MKNSRMRISRRCVYGIHALADLALHEEDGRVLIKEIAGRIGVTPAYLEHLLTPLIIAGMIRSSVGRHGGVVLGRPADQIKLIDAFNILEGPIAVADCIGDAAMCSRSDRCVMRELWTEMTVAISRFLTSRTIADLVTRQKVSVKRCPADDRTVLNSRTLSAVDMWCDESSDFQVMMRDYTHKRTLGT